MNVFEAIILGIIQGLTEFLPVSSSGHLILAQTFFGISEPVMTFDIVLHVGTLVSVCAVYREDVWALIRRPFQKTTLLLIIATIPIVITALLFGDLIDKLFEGGILLAFGFFVTGFFLLYADRTKGGHKRLKDMTGLDALIIGCMQAIAITPAISRSGSTITGSLARKLDRETAAKFSFMLSIPAILGALVLEIKNLATDGAAMDGISFLPMAFGFIAAGLTGYLAVSFMIKLIQKSRLKIFACYVFALGAIVFVHYTVQALI